MNVNLDRCREIINLYEKAMEKMEKIMPIINRWDGKCINKNFKKQIEEFYQYPNNIWIEIDNDVIRFHVRELERLTGDYITVRDTTGIGLFDGKRLNASVVVDAIWHNFERIKEKTKAIQYDIDTGAQRLAEYERLTNELDKFKFTNAFIDSIVSYHTPRRLR